MLKYINRIGWRRRGDRAKTKTNNWTKRLKLYQLRLWILIPRRDFFKTQSLNISLTKADAELSSWKNCFSGQRTIYWVLRPISLHNSVTSPRLTRMLEFYLRTGTMRIKNMTVSYAYTFTVSCQIVVEHLGSKYQAQRPRSSETYQHRQRSIPIFKLIIVN